LPIAPAVHPRRVSVPANYNKLQMTTQLEFLNAAGNEPIAGPIDNYHGTVPAAGDVVYLDLPDRFGVVRRIFYYYPVTAGNLGAFGPEMKISLHCERLASGRAY